MSARAGRVSRDRRVREEIQAQHRRSVETLTRAQTLSHEYRNGHRSWVARELYRVGDAALAVAVTVNLNPNERAELLRALLERA